MSHDLEESRCMGNKYITGREEFTAPHWCNFSLVVATEPDSASQEANNYK